ncbi:hypothetical protein P8452_14100 [Trifolium repens]|nr:hypothetical protein P8452_14100 [Trifolium repens]
MGVAFNTMLEKRDFRHTKTICLMSSTRDEDHMAVLIKKPVECGMQKTYQSHKGLVHAKSVNRYYISLSDLLGLGGRWIFELGGNAWWFD